MEGEWTAVRKVGNKRKFLKARLDSIEIHSFITLQG